MGKSDTKSSLLERGNSMFGKLPHSTRRSNPAYGFGSGNRDTAMAVHITEVHSRAANAGKHSPGPVYPAISSMGPNPDSTKENGNRWTFSKSARFPERETLVPRANNNGKNDMPVSKSDLKPGFGKMPMSTKRSMPQYTFGTGSRDAMKQVVDGETTREYGESFPRASPGPNVCNNRTANGPQVSSTKRSNPSWVLGSERRFKYDFEKQGASMPAAGTYDIPGAMGSQPLSTKKSLPQFSFSASERPPMLSTDSPGPGSLNLKGGNGRQVDSRKKSNASWGFGSAPRFSSVGMKQKGSGRSGPGPGSYSPP